MSWATAMFVLPTGETVQRLQEILQSPPIHIDWDHLRIELARSQRTARNWEANPEAMYVARFTKFHIELDPYETHNLRLVGDLDCTEMSLRMHELVASPELHVPKLIFNSYSPGLAMANKSFIASIDHVLASGAEGPFTFGHELRIDNR